MGEKSSLSLSVHYIAEKFNKPVDIIIGWEDGKESITFSQAQKYADLTHIPFGYLYLNEPPYEQLPIPDRRTIGSIGKPVSLELKDTLNDVLIKQDWYREYAKANDFNEVDVVGALSINNSVTDIVNLIKNRINIPIPPTRGKWTDLLSLLVKKIESLGILVMRNGVVKNNTHRPLSVEDFRGFCIADSYAPVIFINTNDAKSAQLFTLIHELAHLIIGQSAISDLSNYSHAKEEVFCNAVAAEYLTPKELFLKEWVTHIDLGENMDHMVSMFRVSRWVIARRALDLKLIAQEAHDAFINSINEKNPSTGGGDYARSQKVRISERLAVAVATQALVLQSYTLLWHDSS
ncbi:ImmA/IrrE family metallo-endopeptidase [Xenorhabdus griffiniae]|uniref:ImmA/IrrE family metallo-endopeptidase n=1 Tax=Xenorhabdus griffiniae TaxID=351672 RepID=UPI0030CD4E71